VKRYADPAGVFRGRHFQDQIIILCVGGTCATASPITTWKELMCCSRKLDLNAFTGKTCPG
jgi:hypothetical protein